MGTIQVYALTSVIYAILSAHLWHNRHKTGQATSLLSRAERSLILLALILHGYLLAGNFLFNQEVRFGFGHALSAMLWLAVLLYWFESFFLSFAGLHALVLALAAICAPLPAIFWGLEMRPHTTSLPFRLHLILAIASYSLFTLAALHAFLMMLVEHRLHRWRRDSARKNSDRSDPLTGPLATLPPLLTLETLVFRIVALGFVLLTLTLATGGIFSDSLFGRALTFNHKTLFAILSWVIFALLLIGRRFRGWRGRVALRWTLAGFAALLLAYVGSRFVLEVMLHRSGLP